VDTRGKGGIKGGVGKKRAAKGKPGKTFSEKPQAHEKKRRKKATSKRKNSTRREG